MFDVPKGAELLVDGLHGIYVPQRFAKNYDMNLWHVKVSDRTFLLRGPDEPLYWETWDDVINYAWCEKDGKVYNLHTDGDLWAYCPADQEGM